MDFRSILRLSKIKFNLISGRIPLDGFRIADTENCSARAASLITVRASEYARGQEWEKVRWSRKSLQGISFSFLRFYYASLSLDGFRFLSALPLWPSSTYVCCLAFHP
jgi:hypothetical protein